MEKKRKIELLFKRNDGYIKQIDELMAEVRKNKDKIVKLMAQPIEETTEIVTV